MSATIATHPVLCSFSMVIISGLAGGPARRTLAHEQGNREIWRTYRRVQADMLSDPILSFTTIHDRVKRSETGGLRDGTWVSDELARQAGLDIQSPGFARDLWCAAQESYSLERVKREVLVETLVKTPLRNIRITTCFAGESEAKIVDPSRISEVQAVGCEVDYAPPLE